LVANRFCPRQKPFFKPEAVGKENVFDLVIEQRLLPDAVFRQERGKTVQIPAAKYGCITGRQRPGFIEMVIQAGAKQNGSYLFPSVGRPQLRIKVQAEMLTEPDGIERSQPAAELYLCVDPNCQHKGRKQKKSSLHGFSV
jgi:hypothetical protein